MRQGTNLGIEKREVYGDNGKISAHPDCMEGALSERRLETKPVLGGISAWIRIYSDFG